MNRSGELLLIQVQGNRFSTPLFLQCVVAVTHQAGAVVLRRTYDNAANQQTEDTGG
ncbi:MAG: hypothetical protein AABZ61_01430 [Bacteroidota bacterium]